MTATHATTTRPAPETTDAPVSAVVDRARGGDRQAFADLYVRYQPQIYTYLLRRTHDQQLSQDLTSDVFVRALDRIGTFTWRGHDFGAWLATIARNRLLDHLKSARHRREIPTGDMHDHDLAVGDIGELITEQLASADVFAELRHALAVLTRAQQECLRLRYWRDLPHAEIGRRLNRSQHAATSLHQRALRTLRTPHIRAALTEPARTTRLTAPDEAASRADSPTPPQAFPCVPSPRRPAPADSLDPGRIHPMATSAALAPLTAGQAVALVLLRDGSSERSITQRTGIFGDTLYRLAAAHGIHARHGTVEGHRCHEAAGTEPCDKCTLADGRDQARARARHRKSVNSLPRTLRRQATGRRRATR
ncbi:sigma-70 family RNA polymerase sigma factor [Streptomyces sp. NPDC057620]|uniref:sigma-70 family RNA polymerase sigma factor n=1 Tax=Streptomyces sp. NPDC057620 TaxID=3346185 RepID=UPI00367811F7